MKKLVTVIYKPIIVQRQLLLCALETTDIYNQGSCNREMMQPFVGGGDWKSILWKSVTLTIRLWLLKLRNPFATCFCLILPASIILGP